MRKLINAKKISYLLIFLAILLAVYLIYTLYAWVAKNKVTEKKSVAQQITLITPPPPPPPPPPEPEKVEPIEEEVIEETPDIPEEAQDEAPPGQDLGLDADGGAGTDGFGLVGRKGGTGLGLGKAGRYDVMIKERVNELINEDEDLKFLAYSAVITLWVNASGQVEKYSINLEEESPKIKKLLESIVAKMSFESGPPIESADKGIRLRVNSRI